MLTSAPAHLKFPDRSTLRPVTVIPLYLEPKPFSGERICAGIVVIDEHGKIASAPVESLERLACVYGEATGVLVLARDVSLRSLTSFLAEAGAAKLRDWVAPVEGVILGPAVETATSSVTEQLRAALREYSSLAALPPGRDEEDSSRDRRDASLSADRLLKAVRAAVVAIHPERANRFGLEYKVRDDARALKIAYAGNRIVANLALVVPSKLTQRVEFAKARLWDLEQARDGVKRGWFEDARPSHFELLVKRPSQSDVEYSARQLDKVDEAMAELEVEADRRDIRCRPLASPEEIAEHLVAVDQ